MQRHRKLQVLIVFALLLSEASVVARSDTPLPAPNGLLGPGVKKTESAALSAGTTTRVSAASDGTQGERSSYHPGISANGRYVGFISPARNLVSGDTTDYNDVFVHDRQTAQTTRVSVSSNGTPGNDDSLNTKSPSLSADGRYVAFESLATNLVSGDTNGKLDVFLRNRQTGQTSRISVSSGGAQGNDFSFEPSLSADSRYVAFTSFASNLVTGDTNVAYDVFVRDRQTGTTSRVSVASDGAQADHFSLGPSISADGRYVAFTSYASNLVISDTNNTRDIFVRDRQAGQTARVSVAAGGAEGNDDSDMAAISSDGRYVAFVSPASNLVSGDTNGVADVFRHDRVTHTTIRVSVSSSGAQANDESGHWFCPGCWPSVAISGDGRYVAFVSFASNLVPNDTALCQIEEGGPFVNCPDVFIRDVATRQTARVSVASGGAQSNGSSFSPAISADGRLVVFTSDASNLVAGDTNNSEDVFVHDRLGSVVVPTLTAAPASVPADGSSTSTITLSGAPPGHRVRLISSRGNVDRFANASGTVGSDGRYATTVWSSSFGSAIITAQDLTAQTAFGASTTVTFTPVGGGTPPPPQTGDVVITGVEGDCQPVDLFGTIDVQPLDCPKDGFFMLGLEDLKLPLRVSVDWKGNLPGAVEFSINGLRDSIAATDETVGYELNINTSLREGPNVLRIVARSGSKSSSPVDLYLTGYRLPQWIMDGVDALNERVPILGDQALVLEIAFPGQPLCKHKQGRPKNECEEFQWGFLPGDLNHFQWQTNIKLTLPTRGGAFEVEISRERDEATTGRKPKGLLKLIGHEFDLEYHGRLGGVLEPDSPYVIVQELEIGGSIAKEFSKDVGVVEALNVLTPFGPTAYLALSAVPSIRDWLNDRAKLYAKITPELSGKFVLAFQPGFHVANVQLGLDLPVEIGAKADLWVVEGHIYGGLGGRGTFGYAADDIHILSLEAYGFGGYRFRLAWFSLEDQGEWQLAQYPPAADTALFSAAPRDGPRASWHVIGHNRGQNYAVFQAQTDRTPAFARPAAGLKPPLLTAQTVVTSLLVTNVYTYPEPSLAVHPADDNALLLWVHDVVTKPVGQAHEINYSLWNGSSWSTPAGVADDNLLDGAPQVAWSGDGAAVAVWERLNDTLPVTATWDITTAKKIEIATSVYSVTTGAWTPVSLLTANTALDMQPQLARNGAGQLLAVWRQNEHGVPGGTITQTDRIVYTFYDNGWSAPLTAVNGIPGLVDLAVGYGNDSATIAYTQYLTPTGYPTPTLQLFTSTWNGNAWLAPIQRTSDSLGHRNPQVVYNAANQPLAVWLAGNELRLQNLTTSAVVTLTLGSRTVIDEFRLVQDSGGNMAAVFTAQGSQRDLYLSYFDQTHNVWGNAERLTDDRASETYPTAGMDSTGRLLMSYAATAIASITSTTTISGTGEVITFTIPTEGQTDLLTLSHVFTRDLTLDDLVLLADHPAPGDSVTISATLRNSGDLAVSNPTVGFYDGDPLAGGELIRNVSLPATLAGGFTAALATTYTVPLTGGMRVLYAVADPAGTITESDETDNTINMPAFGPDLEIANAGVDYWGGNDVGLVTLIRNIGTTEAPTATLAFYSDAITGTLVATDTVPLLTAGQSIALATPWNFGALAGGSNPLVAAVNQIDFAEVFTANNIRTFALEVRPDLMVSPYYLWTTSPTATTVLVTTTVYNVGAVTATNVLVGFYGDDRLNDNSPLFTRTIPTLGPAGSAMLTGQVTGPLACTLYAYVDPDQAISETTRSNNLAGIAYRGLCQRVYLPIVLRSN